MTMCFELVRMAMMLYNKIKECKKEICSKIVCRKRYDFLWLSLSIEILSFIFGEATKFNGMMWAMVIAVETCET